MASAAPLPERMAAAGGARDKLRVAIETIAEFIDGNQTYALAGLETWNQTRSLPGRPRLAEDPAAAGVEDIRRLLAEGQAGGELGEFDPHVVAVMFRQAVDAITLEAAIDPTADLKAFAAHLVAILGGRERRAPRVPVRRCPAGSLRPATTSPSTTRTSTTPSA